MDTTWNVKKGYAMKSLLRFTALILAATLCGCTKSEPQQVYSAILNESVTAAAISANGKYLAVGHSARGIEDRYRLAIYDARTLQRMSEQKTGLCFKLAFSPGGEYVAESMMTEEGNKEVRVWNTPALTNCRNFGEAQPMRMQFSPDGSRLYGSASRLVAWDVGSGKLCFELHDTMGIEFALSHDGKTIAALGESGRFETRDVATLAVKCTLDSRNLSILEFIPGVNEVFALEKAEGEYWVHRYDLGKQKSIYKIRSKTRSPTIALSPTGEYFVVAFYSRPGVSGGYIEPNVELILVNLNTGEQVGARRLGSGYRYATAFSPDGRLIYTVWEDTETDKGRIDVLTLSDFTPVQ